MKKIILCLTALLFIAGFVLAGCSKEETKVEESKGAIKEFTDKTADKAVKKLKTPVDRAKDIAKIGNQRLDEMDKELEK